MGCLVEVGRLLQGRGGQSAAPADEPGLYSPRVTVKASRSVPVPSAALGHSLPWMTGTDLLLGSKVPQQRRVERCWGQAATSQDRSLGMRALEWLQHGPLDVLWPELLQKRQLGGYHEG